MVSVDLSIHQLVDFVLRKGHIDERSFNSETMKKGSEIHRNYQKHQKKNYFSEVDLRYTINFENYSVNLHGRADGLILENVPTIEEIKSTNEELDEFIETNKDWHLGQAECYAYLYCLMYSVERIDIRLVYISQTKRDKKSIDFFYTKDSLEENVFKYLRFYFDFYDFILSENEKRNDSIDEISFPFNLRNGQDKIIDFCNDTFKNREKSFVEASTGIGKTLAINYSAIKNFNKLDDSKLFFLAAKNSGFESANESLENLRSSGLYIKSVEIVAKEKMCLCKNKNCNPEDCPFARNYYDKLREILFLSLKENQSFTQEKIKEIAIKNEICPFELSLDISNYCDFIIADYNYVFHPVSYLKRYFDTPDYEIHKSLLIDEAHNLIDRSRDMYSAQINFNDFSKAKNSLMKIRAKSIKEILNRISEYFEQFYEFEFDNNYVSLEAIDEDFMILLQNYREKITNYMKKHPKFKNFESKTFNLDLFKFLKIYELLDENYKIFIKKENDNIIINFYCIDSSSFIKDILNKCDSAVFFSGTLNPINYYKESLLGNSECKNIKVFSDFDKKNLKVLISNDISVRYNSRTNTIDAVIERIKTFVNSKIGNYIVYVPSFVYLNLVREKLNIDNANIIYQEYSMTNDEKKNFLDEFKENPEKTTVGICVIGGSFSEGVNLINDRLIGVVIIGVGMPTISYENNLIKEYYDKSEKDGFVFAYVNPGINKIMQAVGRIIRDENDRGMALLIDDRLFNKNYINLFKEYWTNNKKINSETQLISEIKSFYSYE